MNITITDSSVLPKSITIQESGDVVTVNSTTQPVTISTDQLITGPIGSLTDVNITSVTNNQVLAYDSATSKWINEDQSGSGGGAVDSVNGQTGVVVLDTDDISEDGAPTNKYFTDARAQTVIDSNSAGFITATSTSTLTNKSGAVSQFTNDAGYLTSETDSQTLSFATPNISISNGNSVNLGALTTTSLPFSSITSTPTTLAGYGITDSVTGASTTTFTNKSGAISQWTNDAGYSTTTGTVTPTSTDTFTNKSGSNSQWTNDAGYTTNTGTVTPSSTDTFTNKSGAISQWTNDSGYLTSETDSQTLSFSNPNLTISSGNSVDLSALTPSSLPFSSITSTPTTLGGYGITDAVTGASTTTFTNKSGAISQWTNDANYSTTTGTVTPSSTDTFTNKSGNISQWTNDSGYSTTTGTVTPSSTDTFTNKSGAISQWTNDANYSTTTGTVTPSSTDTFTNKSGSNSQWTNDAGYITSAGAGIAAVVDDTTPQLGGNIALNSHDIVGTGNINTTGSIEVTNDATVGGSIIGDSGAMDIKNEVDGQNIQFSIDDTVGVTHIPLKLEQYATIRPNDTTAYDSTVTMPERGFRNGILEFSSTGEQPDNDSGDYELNGFLATSTSKSWTGINLVSTGQAASANPLYDRYESGSILEFPQNVIFLSSANGLVSNPQPLGNGKRVFQLGAFVYDGVKYGGANSIPSFAITCTAAETAASTNARGVKTTFEFLKIGGSGSDGDNSNDRNSTLTLDYEGADIAGDLVVTGDQIDFTNLPTSDPTSAGRLWNDSGTVKISAG